MSNFLVTQEDHDRATLLPPPSGVPEKRESRRPLPSVLDDGGMIGNSEAMRRLGEMLTRVADLDTTVLVQGESGTGKELIARVLHQRSRRSNGPFIAINCATLPATLLESELFGHVRGAFTDAAMDKRGLFEAASGGTLFLDEIGEIPASMQAKLLRVLQERTVRPIGCIRERPVDVHVVTATNRDLEAEVSAGRFREDLYYRVNVVTVDVPPLRERDDDVLLLANHFRVEIAARNNKRIDGFNAEATDALRRHHWPGNVRELRNCVERAVALAAGPIIEVSDLPQTVLRGMQRRETLPPTVHEEGNGELMRISEVERRYIRHVLNLVHDNKSEAARILGIDRRTLHRKLKRTDSDGH